MTQSGHSSSSDWARCAIARRAFVVSWPRSLLLANLSRFTIPSAAIIQRYGPDSRKLDLPCEHSLPGSFQKANAVRANRINSAIVTCLEHMATSTAPPGAGAADFLLKLLDDGVFAIDEIDEITRRVSIILRGITERHELVESAVAGADEPIPPPVIVAAPTSEEGRVRVTRSKSDYQKAAEELRRGTNA